MRKIIVSLACFAICLGTACSSYAQDRQQEEKKIQQEQKEQKIQLDQKQEIKQVEKQVEIQIEKEVILEQIGSEITLQVHPKETGKAYAEYKEHLMKVLSGMKDIKVIEIENATPKDKQVDRPGFQVLIMSDKNMDSLEKIEKVLSDNGFILENIKDIRESETDAKKAKMVIDRMMRAMGEIKSVEMIESNQQKTKTWKGVMGIKTSKIRKIIKSDTSLGIEYVQAFVDSGKKPLPQYESYSKIGKDYCLVRGLGSPEWTIQVNTIFIGQPSSEKAKLMFDSRISPKIKGQEKVEGVDCFKIESDLNPSRIFSLVIPGVHMDYFRSLRFTFTIWIGEKDNRWYKSKIVIDGENKKREQEKEVEKKAFLGVNIAGESPEGVIIDFVTDGSAAEKAGIKGGDIIAAIDGEKIELAGRLVELISMHKPGDEVVLKVLRGGEELELKAKLGAREEHDDWERMEINFTNETETIFFNFNENSEFEIPDEVKVKFGLLPYLGVYTKTYDEGDVDGVIILMVVKNSPAAKDGLRKGDIIAEIDGKQILSPEQLNTILKQHKIGEEINIKIVTRAGKLQEKRIKLGTYPEPKIQKHNYNRNIPEPDISIIKKRYKK